MDTNRPPPVPLKFSPVTRTGAHARKTQLNRGMTSQSADELRLPSLQSLGSSLVPGAPQQRHRKKSLSSSNSISSLRTAADGEGSNNDDGDSPQQRAGAFQGILNQKICGFGMGTNMSIEAVLYKARIDNRINPVLNRYQARPASESPHSKSLEEQVKEELNELLHPREKSKSSASVLSPYSTGRLKSEGEEDDEEDEKAFDSGGDYQEEDGEDLEPDQRVALTLNNWCHDDDNTKLLVKEGGLRALSHLAVHGDRKTRKYVVSAYYRLAERPELRQHLLENNTVWALSQLSNGITSLRMGRHCAAAICFITMKHGEEKRTVQEGAVVAMTYLISLSEQKGRDAKYSIAPICLQALFNLTCVEEVYPGLEKVLHALVMFSLISSVDCRYVLARALANVSWPHLKMSLKMVEHNAIPTVMSIFHNPTSRFPRADVPTRLTVAWTLFNVAKARHCRADLIMQGLVKSLHGSLIDETASEDDSDILYCMAGVMHHLSKDFPGRLRCLYDEAIAVLQVLYNKTQSISAIRMISSALMHFSEYEDCIQLMLGKDTLQLLNGLSRSIKDQQVAHTCMFAYCNMLTQDQSRAAMLEGGALQALLGLADVSDNESFLQAMSVTLFNMTCGEFGNQLVESGLLEVLLRILGKKTSAYVQKFCLAAVANIASMTSKLEGLARKGVVQCLVPFLITGDNEVKKHTAIALAIIARDISEKVHNAFDETAVKAITKLSAFTTCHDTRAALGALLCCLTFTPRLRAMMASVGSKGTIGGLGALVALSFGVAGNEGDQKLRAACATAFCNFSCDETQRGQMVTRGAVKQLLEISNTYAECIQEDCAKCLCNLSCYPETHEVMVQEGALQVIMMIVMVRSTKESTQRYCAMALLNLIGKMTLDRMLEEGITQAFSELASGNSSEETLAICSRAFCSLSCFPKGREKIAERHSTLQGLFSLSRSTNVDTQVNCCRATCNLLVFSESRIKATNGGALGAMKVLAVTSITECLKRCPSALAILACDPACQDRIVKEHACSILIHLTQHQDQEVLLGAVRAICCVAYHKPLRRPLVEAGAVGCLIVVVFTGGQNFSMLREDLARAFCYLSVVKENRPVMVRQKVVLALVLLCKRSSRHPNVEALCTLTLQYLSWNRVAHQCMVQEGGVQLLVELLMEGHNKDSIHDIEVVRDFVLACSNISSNEDQLYPLIQLKIVEALDIAANMIMQQSEPEQDMEVVLSIIKAIYNLSQRTNLREEVVAQGGAVALVNLAPFAHLAGQQSIACALCNLSKVQSVQSRRMIVDAGAMPVLSKLSSNDNVVTQKMCSIALANLSGYAKVQGGAVSSLLHVAFKDEPTLSSELLSHMTTEEDEMDLMESSKTSTSERSRANSRAINVVKAFINIGTFLNAAEKRAPGVFQNINARGLRHIIDLPPPIDLQRAERANEMHRGSYYGDTIFEAAVTRSLKYPRVAAGMTSLENRPDIKPLETTPVFYIQKQPIQPADVEEDELNANSEDVPLINLPFKKEYTIPSLQKLAAACESSAAFGNNSVIRKTESESSRLSEDSFDQSPDMFPKVSFKIRQQLKRRSHKLGEEKDTVTSLPKLKSLHKMPVNSNREKGGTGTKSFRRSIVMVSPVNPESLAVPAGRRDMRSKTDSNLGPGL